MERDHYWNVSCRLWSRSRKGGFPGCNPCSLSRQNLTVLPSHDYLISLKSDGVRYALLLTLRPETTSEDPSPVAIMIDRARNMYEVEVMAEEAHFVRNTLLEGELVWHQPDKRYMLYLVFDAIAIKGESLLQRSYSERLNYANKYTRWSEDLGQESGDVEQRIYETDTIVMCHYHPRIVMRPKRFVERRHAVRLWSERTGSEHCVDGIILNRADSTYVNGTATGHSVFKWKEQSTVDLRGHPPTLLTFEGPLPKTLRGMPVEIIPSRIETGEDTVAEYHVEVTQARVVRLFATRVRPDKDTPNSIKVVEATVQDVIDAVTPEELASES